MLDAYGAKQFGKYELIAEIGRGAFGIVYKAKDSVLGRYVAIKVLHPALLVDPGFIERFRHEARVAALLDHPNIVPVYDFGQEDGRYFLVMAYMPGGSLSTLIENAAPMPAERVIKITKEIGAGLSYTPTPAILSTVTSNPAISCLMIRASPGSATWVLPRCARVAVPPR